MSIHAIPSGLDLDKGRRLIIRFLREPSGVVFGNGPDGMPTAIEFTPDLSAEEVATLADIIAVAQSPLDWGPEDLTVFKAERATLAAYLANSNPTNAQSVAAIKSLIRVVAAIVRA